DRVLARQHHARQSSQDGAQQSREQGQPQHPIARRARAQSQRWGQGCRRRDGIGHVGIIAKNGGWGTGDRGEQTTLKTLHAKTQRRAQDAKNTNTEASSKANTKTTGAQNTGAGCGGRDARGPSWASPCENEGHGTCATVFGSSL